MDMFVNALRDLTKIVMKLISLNLALRTTKSYVKRSKYRSCYQLVITTLSQRVAQRNTALEPLPSS